jgi:hypothetical protein
LIRSASGTPSWPVRTSERRKSSSIQYGPSVIVGVSAAVAAAALSVASASSVRGSPRRAAKIDTPAEPARPSARLLVILSIVSPSFVVAFAIQCRARSLEERERAL